MDRRHLLLHHLEQRPDLALEDQHPEPARLLRRGTSASRSPPSSRTTPRASAASPLVFEASSESNKDAWKQFHASTLTMSTTYDRAPKLPSIPATSPGGPCQTGSPAATVIGNDDVTFETVATDPDSGQLGTQFVIKNYGGATVYDSGDPQTASGALTSSSGGVVRLVLNRAQIQGWHTDGATDAYAYSWYTRTSDGKLYSPTTGTGSAGSPCNFTYDPSRPGEPGATVTTDAAGDAGALGQNATFTLAPCAGALDDPPTACTGTSPNRYPYQINSSPPQSVPATGGIQTVQIPLTHAGPNTLTVFAISRPATSGIPPRPTSPSPARVSLPRRRHRRRQRHQADLLAAAPAPTPACGWPAVTEPETWAPPPTSAPPAPRSTAALPTGTAPRSYTATSPATTSKTLSPTTPPEPRRRQQPAVRQRRRPSSQPLLRQPGEPATGSVHRLHAQRRRRHPHPTRRRRKRQPYRHRHRRPDRHHRRRHQRLPARPLHGLWRMRRQTYSYPQTLAGPADSPDGAGDWNDFSLTTAQPAAKPYCSP